MQLLENIEKAGFRISVVTYNTILHGLVKEDNYKGEELLFDLCMISFLNVS